MKAKKNTNEPKEKLTIKKRCLDWKGFYGLGKGLWKTEDAQEYVNRLRGDRQSP